MNKDTFRNSIRKSKIAAFIYTRMIGFNWIKMGGTVLSRGAFLKRSKISAIGSGNLVVIESGVHLTNAKIIIHGNNNTVLIKKNVSGSKLEIVIDDNENNVEIGEKTIFSGYCHLACIEGTSIKIGADCLFSANIVFRTGDSHSIIDDCKNRINPSKNIDVGNHVWIGNGVTVLKGARISNDSVVGTGSIVTKEYCDTNVILAGVPAKIIKRNINWNSQRV